MRNSFLAPAFAVLIAGAAYQHQKTESMAAALRASHLHRQVGTGKTAVVTGATSGIGQACALRLAEAGTNSMGVVEAT